jgi:hypothetical protein
MNIIKFWWREIFIHVDEYRSISQCIIVNGFTVLFWKDFWSNGELLCEKFPRLFSNALDEDISVALVAFLEYLITCFALPILLKPLRSFRWSLRFSCLFKLSTKVWTKEILCGVIDTLLPDITFSYLSVLLKIKHSLLFGTLMLYPN